MKILLLGEYSSLHNTLKEGLLLKGCDVTLLGDGDGFKDFPSDISIKPKIFNETILKYLKLGVYKITGWDLTKLERGIRFYNNLNKLKGYDAVQLINERPIKTYASWERYLLKRVFNNNKKIVLLSCGADFMNIRYALNHKEETSLLTPYFKNQSLKPQFSYALEYLKKKHKKTHELVYKNIEAVIATDFDYVTPLKNHSKFKGLIPYPVLINTDIESKNNESNSIHILLGINRWNYYAKGIPFFEDTLIEIKKKYCSKVTIIKAENLPYKTYREYLLKTDIVLDQVYAKDQGYNALESMAMGKAVFTGANKDFIEYYNLKEDQVCIEAKPEVKYLIKKLSQLIENPEKIKEIGKQAQIFVEKEHHHLKIAEKYLAVYKAI